jgi:predicted RNA-binding protein with EMAP domain
MNDQTKLILALMQVDNLTSLIEGNEYQKFLYSHLISVQVELQRQLTNLRHSSTIKE